jgi:DNA polymerase-3 subunit delta'
MPFRDIAGHRHVLELVARAAGRGSLPPSLIFAGPEGVGKRMAAVALAQLVNCRKVDSTGDACGKCAACTRIARNVYSDVLIVEPGDTGAIKIDQIREAIDRTAYRPFEGRLRVVIIDGADAMQPESQNALLKTLEEPPSASMFVLVTSRPDVLLPTVRSRCQRLRFGRLTGAEVADVLVRAHDYDQAEAQAAASVADGSVGAALEGGSEGIVEARTTAAAVLSGIASAPDARRRLDSARKLLGGGDRDELVRRLRALASMLRDLGAIRSRADERHLANADFRASLGQLTGAYDGDRLTRAFSAIDQAIDAVNRNAGTKIVADWIAFQL